MAARVCGTPGCPELKPCPHHVPAPGWNTRPSKRNQTRPSDAMEIRDRVRQRDEGICYWCGEPGARHVDHILAVADGGTWDESNMAVMHEACHDEKTRIEAARRTHTPPSTQA